VFSYSRVRAKDLQFVLNLLVSLSDARLVSDCLNRLDEMRVNKDAARCVGTSIGAHEGIDGHFRAEDD
jgi:hypothetical protein